MGLAELEELFPINSPELGRGPNASGLGGSAELRGHSSVGVGKKEDILGAVTYGKTAGEAAIIGSLERASKLQKRITRSIAAEAESLLEVVAMNGTGSEEL